MSESAYKELSESIKPTNFGIIIRTAADKKGAGIK